MARWPPIWPPRSLCKRAASDRVNGPSAAEDGPVGFGDAAGVVDKVDRYYLRAGDREPDECDRPPVRGRDDLVAPLVSAGRVTWAIRVKGNARSATAAAPRTASVPLERTTTSGSRASSSADHAVESTCWPRLSGDGVYRRTNSVSLAAESMSLAALAISRRAVASVGGATVIGRNDERSDRPDT